MSYTKSKEPFPLTVTLPAAVTATQTFHVTIPPFTTGECEIVQMTVGSTANLAADDGTNYWTFVASNGAGSAAMTINTGTTDINATAVQTPAAGIGARANRLVTAGTDVIRLTITKVMSATQIDNGVVTIWVAPVRDLAGPD